MSYFIIVVIVFCLLTGAVIFQQIQIADLKITVFRLEHHITNLYRLLSETGEDE